MAVATLMRAHSLQPCPKRQRYRKQAPTDAGDDSSGLPRRQMTRRECSSACRERLARLAQTARTNRARLEWSKRLGQTSSPLYQLSARLGVTGRRVSVTDASNRAASGANAGAGPSQRNSSTSSKTGTSVRSVARVRKRSACSRLRERVSARALEFATFPR